MLDADDVAEPERLAKQYAYMQAHPEVAVLGTQLQLLGPYELWCRLSVSGLLLANLPEPLVRYRIHPGGTKTSSSKSSNSGSAAALPNEFFDFITAGLALCIGPSPEMARLTRQYQCGVVGASFEPAEIARVLRQLSAANIDAMKRASIAARAQLSSEHELPKVRQVVAEALA